MINYLFKYINIFYNIFNKIIIIYRYLDYNEVNGLPATFVNLTTLLEL